MMGHTVYADVAPNRLRSELIFSEGHAIHERWQTWLREMGVLWGGWQCIHCDELVQDWSDNLVNTECPNGVTKHQWKYREVPLSLGRISGHADGIVNPTSMESFILEAKSIGPGTLRKLDVLMDDEADFSGSDKFSKITRPLGDHFRQLQIYLRLLRSTPVGDESIDAATRGIMIYEYKADQQVREFVVTYNPHWTDELFDIAEDIEWAVDHDREIKCPYGGCFQCKIYEEQ